jgi:hypothetical protein
MKDAYDNELWNKLPHHTAEALRFYIETGRPVGHFLTAVLSNDLYMAVNRADEENQKAIVDYIKWLVNYAPAECWGSPDHVKSWYIKMEKRRTK